MPSYKLTYFNGKGRAEVSRYLFKMNDAEFEDCRIEGTWQEFKPKTPFGQMPILEFDGETICQSSAIERLLAKRFGMYGKDDKEQAKSDMVVGCAEDVFQKLIKCMSGTDEEKAEKKKKLAEDELPTMLTNLEKMMNGDNLFVSSNIMWADVSIAHTLVFLEIMKVPIDLSKYVKLSAMKEKVESHPKIAAWIKERPETSF